VDAGRIFSSMTNETRTTIQLSDIKAIEFECSACHCRIVRPVGGLQPKLLACPECGITWAQFERTMDFLSRTVSQLAKVAEVDKPENQSPFVVRFELVQPTRKESL
jgi:hypothetical protein